MITAAAFDLGNVLIDWQPEHAIARAVGMDEARRFLASYDFRAWNHLQDQGMPFEESERQAIAAHPEWAEHLLAYRRNFVASLVGPIDGAVDLVRELHRRGVPVFALTNWSAETFHHARERFAWLDLFADIVVSGQERVAKPDPAIFELLSRRSGVPLDQLFYTDDSPRHVTTARALGMTAVVFASPEQLRRDLVAAGLLPD
ncbi:HAD family hydrolase [Nocardioides terrisoli]|uniref:HAD family hydrolase n=1 Tax=Nocardioides terrisoli TaxID=3388267 RepID=UPI00287BB62C|nr:HAD family phosphatase [Nocardioides marmorisolisilvae]